MSMQKGRLQVRAAASLLWAAALFDAAFLYIVLQFLHRLVSALLDEAGLGLHGFRNAELNQAGAFATGLLTFVALLLIYWIICEAFLGGKTLGRQCLMLELRDESGKRPSASQIRRRARAKITTLGLRGLSLRRADAQDARNQLTWWSPLAAGQASPWRDWSIFVESGTYSGTSHMLERLENFARNRTIQIGRDVHWADIPLDRDAQVSGRHATLRYHEGVWELIDMGSRNKTYAGSMPLQPHVPHPLPPDRRFRVANVQLRLKR